MSALAFVLVIVHINLLLFFKFSPFIDNPKLFVLNRVLNKKFSKGHKTCQSDKEIGNQFQGKEMKQS